MTIKSILVATMFEADLDAIEPGRQVVAHATQMAADNTAHLSIAVGACRLSLPSVGMVSEARGLVARANKEREEKARLFAADLLRDAQAAGVSASLHVVQSDYSGVCAGVLALARASDLVVMQPSDEALSIGQGVLEELLFNAGRPVLVVPTTAEAAPPRKIAIAWDGSAKAARAIGDAMPFIEGATEVEIVTIEGDPNRRKWIEGTDLAPHLARHARQVRVTNLPCSDGDIARVLAAHAAMTRADLLVMGAYGHSRLREFVLGGVTREMIRNPPVPVLMSY